MSRAWKIVAGVVAVLLVLAVAVIVIARSDWLREKVRERIVTEAEKATGGRVEIGKFLWDWKTLTAEIDGFVIHGTEPASGPPLLRIEKLVVGLKIVSLVKRDFDISTATVERPQAYLLVAADGTTNVPNPKTPPSGKTTAETILDLKIGQFALRDGTAEVHAAGQAPKVTPYDAFGRNLQSKFVYEAAGPRYRGTLSLQPLELRYGAYKQTPVNVDMNLAIEKNVLRVTSAKLATQQSHIELSGLLNNFSAPVITAQYNGDVSLAELGGILQLKSRQSGNVQLGGDARYVSATDFLVTGNVHATGVAFAQNGFSIRNVRADSAVRMDPKLLELTGLRASALGGNIVGRAELREFEDYKAEGTLEHLDIAQVQKLPYDGMVSGPFKLQGRLSDTRNQHTVASARLNISPAGRGVPVRGLIDAKYDGARDQVIVAPSWVLLPSTRLDVGGVLGQQLKVRLESRDLNDLLPALNNKPVPVTLKQGSVIFDGTVTGKLESPVINGHVAGNNFLYSGEFIDSVNADLTAQKTGASVKNGSLTYQNVRASFEGSVGLREWKAEDFEPVTANLSLQNAKIPDLLALAGQKGLPVTGTLTATAHVSGTVGTPLVAADVNIVNGSAYQEPFDRVTAKLNYANGGTEIATVNWRAGQKQIDLNARYQHAPNDFQTGKLHFQVTSNKMPVSQFVTVTKLQPGLSGIVAVNATGDVAVKKSDFEVSDLTADVAATGIQLDRRALGDAHLTARTEGQVVNAHLESDLGHSDIKGDGQFHLSGDYPSTGQVTFAKVDVATMMKLFASADAKQNFAFTGPVDGKLSFNGPLKKPEALTAALEIPHIEVKPQPGAGMPKDLAAATIHNTETIRISLANSIVKVDSARFAAPNTDVSITGTASLKPKGPVDLNVNGKVDLSLAKMFDSEITSSGELLARVTVRGTLDQPQLGGSADLRNGNFALASLPNGLSNANGHILFDQNRATIENLTGQTGGGTVKVSGFAAFGSSMSFRLRAVASDVRVRYPEGVSSVSTADLNLTGTSERSVLAGDITVQKVSYNPQSDLGSILSLTNNPAPSQAAPTGLMAGMQFDVHIQTSPDITFQTGLVEGLETEANLRLRGTAANPALLGRILIDQGNITFFGNKYVINQGTISFFNPVRIEPILNIDMETKARGVDVSLTVSGPLTKLNVTYRSDPPLQFSDIVGLLATGKTPSDPTIAARQTGTQQSWEQLGATALVGQAIANPIAGRLQRFLGVSKLKIDPLLPGLGGSGSGSAGGSPGARLSIEQQITPNIIFNYVINTNSTSSQIVRVEWAFSKNWSAVVLREENSAFGIDFQYKKRFK